MKNLNEDSRNQLINKSKRADLYDPNNRDLGKNRYQRRLKSRISNHVAEYNKINMNKLFKEDILDVNIRVQGETDLYLVKISFNGFLNSLSGFMPEDSEDTDLSFKMILRALLDAFNHNDVYVHCTCPDFQYRESYWCTVNGTNAGPAETRPSDETNPNDTKGYCKHINLVLNNNSWMMKVASVITNYIKYMRDSGRFDKLYAKIIYPAIFDREYVKPVEKETEPVIDNTEPETDELASDEDTIDISNKWARTKNQFKPGHQGGYQFAGNDEDKQLDLDSIDIDEPVPDEDTLNEQ